MQAENKTIDEVARASKKTKRTVYNHLEKLKVEQAKDIGQYLVTIGNIQYLTPKGQIEIYNSLGDTRQAKKVKKLLEENNQEIKTKETKKTPQNDQENAETKEYIKDLRKQISSMQSQIERQGKQIDRLLEIVDTQSKQIALDTVNKEKNKKIIESSYTTKREEESKENKETFLEKVKNLFK